MIKNIKHDLLTNGYGKIYGAGKAAPLTPKGNGVCFNLEIMHVWYGGPLILLIASNKFFILC